MQVGEFADVRLNAYPDRVFRAHIDNIGPILDPTIRTAKVRLEVENRGLMRLGMFVTATFHGMEKQVMRIVPCHGDPASARSRLGLSSGRRKTFRRAEVIGGDTLPDNMQEVSGINPGEKVVKDALVLEKYGGAVRQL